MDLKPKFRHLAKGDYYIILNVIHTFKTMLLDMLAFLYTLVRTVIFLIINISLVKVNRCKVLADCFHILLSGVPMFSLMVTT